MQRILFRCDNCNRKADFGTLAAARQHYWIAGVAKCDKDFCSEECEKKYLEKQAALSRERYVDAGKP